MSEPDAAPAATEPVCPRCRTGLVPAPLPPGAFGVLGDGCVDCSDGTPTRQQPWACPRCGTVYLLDAACRI